MRKQLPAFQNLLIYFVVAIGFNLYTLALPANQHSPETPPRLGAQPGISPLKQQMPSPGRYRPQLGKGVFLIANRGLNDPNFSHTVVLITDYSKTGTAGLIINRPLQVPAIEVFPDISQLSETPGVIHMGGPVAVNRLQMIIQTVEKFEQSAHLFAGIYLVDNPRILRMFINRGNKSTAARLYAGYTGWAAGQLESELQRGDWYLWHADENILFSKTPEAVWLELIHLVSAQWAGYNNAPGSGLRAR